MDTKIMKNVRSARALVALAVVVSIGGVAFAQPAQVRAIHASPDAPNVDILVNNGTPPLIQNLAFKSATGYVSVAAGDYNFKVRPAGAPTPTVIDATVPLAAGSATSVVAIGRLANIEPLVLSDDLTQNPSAARVRFVHASPNAPAVDIAIAGGGVLFPNFSFRQASAYQNIPGGTYNLEVRLAGTSQVVLPIGNVTLSNNTVLSVFAMGLAGDGVPAGQALTAVPIVDVIPAPGAAALLGLGGLLAARRRR